MEKKDITIEDMQEAAEKHFPSYGNKNQNNAQRKAFIAGAKYASLNRQGWVAGDDIKRLINKWNVGELSFNEIAEEVNKINATTK